MSRKMVTLGLATGGANLLPLPPKPSLGEALLLEAPPVPPRGAAEEPGPGDPWVWVPVLTQTRQGRAPHQRGLKKRERGVPLGKEKREINEVGFFFFFFKQVCH